MTVRIGADSAMKAGLSLLMLRLGLVGTVTFLGWMLVRVTTGADAFPPGPGIAALALLPANLLCLNLLRHIYRSEGRTLRDVFGGSPRDIGWGLLWVMVLYVPFAVTVVGVMWLLHGADTFTAFETVFFDPDAVPAFPAAVALTLGVVTVLTFAPLNAPAEELVYRGYAQTALTRAWSAPAAIGCSAVALQDG